MESKYLRNIVFSLMGFSLVVLILGFVLDNLFGADIAVKYVYTAPWTVVLWVVTMLMGAWYVVRSRHRKRMTRWAFFIHLSFFVILTGAMLTHFFGRSGRMVLKMNEPTSTYFPSREVADYLPFSVMLDEFFVSNESDTTANPDYVCRVSILDEKKKDDKGDNLSIRDVLRPQDNNNELPEFSLGEFVEEKKMISAGGTIRMGKTYNYHGWRFHMPDSENQSLDECVLFVSHDPFGIVVTFIGYGLLIISLLLYLLFDHRHHHSHHHRSHHEHPGSKIAEHMVEHDAPKKLGLILLALGLFVGQNMEAATVSSTPNVDAIFPYTLPLAIVTTLLAAVFFIVYTIIRGRGKRLPKWCGYVMAGALLVDWCFLSTMLGWQWHLSGQIPLSSGVETLQTFAWLAMLSGLVFCLRSRSSLSYGFVVAAVALIVSAVIAYPADPMLQESMSFLLITQKIFKMLAWVLLAFVMLNGLVAVFMPGNERHIMRHMSNKMLRPAVCFLTIGLVLGAVSANYVWGSYWHWNVNEVWGLLSLFLFVVPLHGNSLTLFQRPLFYHIYMIGAFLIAALTWFL